MILKSAVVTSLMVNCYILGCEETKEAVIIDPGGNVPALLHILEQDHLKLKYIINTHGHVDHIGGNSELKNATQAQLMIHAGDANLLTQVDKSAYIMYGLKVDTPPADILLHDKDIITIGKTIELNVIHTPGHSPGGICLELKGTNALFVGDTLFQGSIGRTDFPGGNYQQLINSIKTRLLVFPDDQIAYPGHGPATTIGFERLHNPFL